MHVTSVEDGFVSIAVDLLHIGWMLEPVSYMVTPDDLGYNCLLGLL